MGFFFGIGGVLTFQNARKLKEAAEYNNPGRFLPPPRTFHDGTLPSAAPERQVLPAIAVPGRSETVPQAPQPDKLKCKEKENDSYI